MSLGQHLNGKRNLSRANYFPRVSAPLFHRVSRANSDGNVTVVAPPAHPLTVNGAHSRKTAQFDAFDRINAGARACGTNGTRIGAKLISRARARSRYLKQNIKHPKALVQGYQICISKGSPLFQPNCVRFLNSLFLFLITNIHRLDYFFILSSNGRVKI